MMKEIKVWWEGPFSIEDIVKNKIDAKKYDNTADQKGLYQIYGFHPLYGSDVLLYIGRTKDQHGFKSRLKNRWQINNNLDSENVKIFLGCIMDDAKALSEEEEVDSIEKAEVLLINAMMPALNSSNIQSVGEKYADEKYIVKNFGNFKNIYPILDSNYYWKNFLNIMITDKLAKEYDSKVSDDDDCYGFDLKENDNIFFGVDYACWDENYPLVVGIYKESVNNLSLLQKSFGNDLLDCEDDYYFIKVADDLSQKGIYDIAKNKIEKLKTFAEKSKI